MSCTDELGYRVDMSWLSGIIILALASTLGIMLTGVLTMGKKGEEQRRRSNKLMRWRVVAQFATIMLILLFAILASE